jgi:hypothetical protein
MRRVKAQKYVTDMGQIEMGRILGRKPLTCATGIEPWRGRKRSRWRGEDFGRKKENLRE